MIYKLDKNKPDDITRVHSSFLNIDGNLFDDETVSVERASELEIRSKNYEGSSYGKVERYSDGSQAFFVKVGTVGWQGGNLANPWHGMSRADQLSHVDRISGRRYFEYLSVTESVFSQYVRFLQTRNQAHLRNAEREALRG